MKFGPRLRVAIPSFVLIRLPPPPAVQRWWKTNYQTCRFRCVVRSAALVAKVYRSHAARAFARKLRAKSRLLARFCRRVNSTRPARAAALARNNRRVAARLDHHVALHSLYRFAHHVKVTIRNVDTEVCT